MHVIEPLVIFFDAHGKKAGKDFPLPLVDLTQSDEAGVHKLLGALALGRLWRKGICLFGPDLFDSRGRLDDAT